jgi:hypothetical protein
MDVAYSLEILKHPGVGELVRELGARGGGGEGGGGVAELPMTHLHITVGSANTVDNSSLGTVP